MQREASLARAMQEAARGADTPAVLDLVGPPAVRPFFAAMLADAQGADRQVLAVVATTREAEDLASALRCFLPADLGRGVPVVGDAAARAALARGPTPSGVGWHVCAGSSTRTRSDGRIRVVVAPVRAVLQPIVNGLGELEPVSWRVGDDLDLDDVLERLVLAGYSRTDLVERRGEFAVRGGILDVFPPTSEHPLRTEFWGDTVEADPAVRRRRPAQSSRAAEPLEELWAPACRELVLTESVRERAQAVLAEHPELDRRSCGS